jgi:membrane associated rhomboid family serine protease
MIFPLLRGLLWFHRAPITWIMVALNVGMFALTFPAYIAADQAIEDLLDNDAFIATNGLLFAATMDVSKEPESVRLLASRTLEGNEDAKQLLGHLAFRRADFMGKMKAELRAKPIVKITGARTTASVSAFSQLPGDQVLIEAWHKSIERLWSIQQVHPSYRMGLSDGNSNLLRWFTYQITHSGAVHLFWNMLFLLLFGTFIEHTRGSKAMAATVWAGGFGGAIAFVLLSGLTASPMVGASAAVSSLIAMAASDTKRRLPFVYWLLPFRGYYGVAWLPAWVLIPGFVLPDLSGWLSSQPGLSGVAYTAHIGGAVVGFALGLYFKPRPEAFQELAQGVTGTAASSTKFAA